uniref:Inhibitor of growth protein n=1 Tax=Romanomermis culicivorax TaxID=13658 RepID=A0A915IPC3_ROMCU
SAPPKIWQSLTPGPKKVALSPPRSRGPASAFDAACAVSYLEDYLDCVESLPQDIQARISKIRKLDSEYCESLKRIKSLRGTFFKINGDDYQKRLILSKIRAELLIGQELSDEQIKHLNFLNEILEVKVRTLDQESRNLESGISDNLFNIVSPNNNQQQSSALQKQPNSHVTNNSRHEKQKILNHNQQQNSSEESETSNNNSRTSSSTPCQNSAKFGSCGYKRSKRLKYSSQTPQKSLDPPKIRESSVLSNFKDRFNLNHNTNGRSPAAAVNADSDDSQDRLLTSGHNSRCKNNQSPACTNFSTSSSATTNQNQRRRKKGSAVINGKEEESTKNCQHQQPKNAKMKYSLPVDPDEPTYCSCNQALSVLSFKLWESSVAKFRVSYGEMIGCDNNECEIEWYHFECVNLTSKPKGKWYCPNCRGDRSNIMKENNNNNQQNS